MELTKDTLLVIIASLELLEEEIHQMVSRSTMLQNHVDELISDFKNLGPYINADELVAVKHMLRYNSNHLNLF